MKDNINRVAGKWLSEQKYQTGELDQEYKGYYDVDMPKILADFAQFYHKQKMKEVIEKIELMQDNSGREGCTYGDTHYDSLSAVYGYNQGLQNAIKLLSDLTKTEEG